MGRTYQERYGNWAMVTGASSGIGAEFANQLAVAGMNLILVARRADLLDAMASDLSARHGVEVRCVAADLGTETGIDAVCAIPEEIGLLVHSAGVEVNGAFETTDADQGIALLRLNVLSTFRLTHHFCQGMLKRGRGGIVLVSSLSGHMPNPYFSNYAGSKAYVLNFGASLRAELRPKGIDVHVLSPGPTDTPMAAGTGLDWSKVPSSVMSADAVVTEALGNLGGKFLTAPGLMNKMTIWMAKHSPTALFGRINEKVLKNALPPEKLG